MTTGRDPRRALLVVMCAGYFLVLLDVTIVNVALPSIGSGCTTWWPRCSSRPAAASKPSWTGASTGAAMTPPRPSPPSAPACATRST
jgi:hypothetical protein